MTLRLTDAETDALSRQAQRENRPMSEVVRDAVREYVERRQHRAAVASSVAWALDEYAEALAELAER